MGSSYIFLHYLEPKSSKYIYKIDWANYQDELCLKEYEAWKLFEASLSTTNVVSSLSKHSLLTSRSLWAIDSRASTYMTKTPYSYNCLSTYIHGKRFFMLRKSVWINQTYSLPYSTYVLYVRRFPTSISHSHHLLPLSFSFSISSSATISLTHVLSLLPLFLSLVMEIFLSHVSSLIACLFFLLLFHLSLYL